MRHSLQPLFARPTYKKSPEIPIYGLQMKKLNLFSKSAMISLSESTIKKFSGTLNTSNVKTGIKETACYLVQGYVPKYKELQGLHFFPVSHNSSF